MTDVMWARPDGTRLLLVDRLDAQRFITAVYRFDAVAITEIRGTVNGDGIEIDAGTMRLSLQTGRQWPIPLARLRRWPPLRPIESALAGWLLGVRTHGTSPTGVREWYRADGYRRVVAAKGQVNGRDLGGLAKFQPPAGFGFSEPPRRAAVVRVTPRLDDPDGRIREALGRPWHSEPR